VATFDIRKVLHVPPVLSRIRIVCNDTLIVSDKSIWHSYDECLIFTTPKNSRDHVHDVNRCWKSEYVDAWDKAYQRVYALDCEQVRI
jgi:hypothetical protein